MTRFAKTSRTLRPILAVVLGMGLSSPAIAGEPSKDRLVVHEWGTFTSFSGSDGIQLEYRPLVGNDLPRFVHSDGGLRIFQKQQVRARQRMETPVTYFYSDVERDVRVSVSFPKGRLTEFYPPPRKQESVPATDGLETAVEMIDWGTVHLLPASSLLTHVANPAVADRLNRHVASGLVPWEDADNPYYHARETDSNLLLVRRTAEDERNLSMASSDFGGDHFEKFLFYRGTGNFVMPVTVEALGNDQVRINNLSPGEIHGAFVVHNDGQGQIRSRFVGNVPGSSHVDATLPDWASAGTDPVAELDANLGAVLKAEGLYEKEATAMINTWRHSWYREPGMRVFFLVPQVITDEILPLNVEPKPDEMIRVLVARMEFMTPEEEKTLQTELKNSVTQGEKQRAAFIETLGSRGRLAEPALKHAAKISGDPAVVKEAETIVAILNGHTVLNAVPALPAIP